MVAVIVMVLVTMVRVVMIVARAVRVVGTVLVFVPVAALARSDDVS